MQRPGEHARQLLRRAQDDAYMLRRLAQDPNSPTWGLGFHAQQAVEKALKAVLSQRGVEYPYTHNLAALVHLLNEAGLSTPQDAAEFARLTPFGAPLRYEAPVTATPAEMPDRRWLQETVRRTLEWAEVLLGESGTKP
jgi:HEPN domain-containing protein